jgi:hypothetical protein
MNFEKSPPVHAATNRANPVLEYWDKRLASGEIDEARWYHETTAAIAATYVSADDPRAQSGFHGDDNHWKQARGLITDGIHRSGALLDAGCANWIFDGVSSNMGCGKGSKARAVRLGHLSGIDRVSSATVAAMGKPILCRKCH